MKKNLRHKLQQTIYASLFSPLLIALTLYSTQSYAVTTYIVGKMGSTITATAPGPTTDGSITLIYPSKPTVIFSRTSELAPANVVLNWDDSHGTSNNTSGLYCTKLETGTGRGLTFESSYISAGSYGGVEIFKTNVTGLYFSMELRSFSAYNQATFSPTSFKLTSGVMHEVLHLTQSGEKCNETNTTGEPNYAVFGGVGFYSKIIFYTDQTYTPGASSVSLLKTADYDLRFWNENPGADIHGYYVNVVYDISSVIISEPTCSTQPVASGSSVNGTTVDLGRYSPNDIIKGVEPVPFSIQLAGCKGLRNINVTLSATTLASTPTMLGNILTSSNATGIGLEISGAANNYSAQMVMIPNDTTSVYNDQRNTSNDINIYGSGEKGTNQSHTLNFLATLKRDGTHQIGSGHFKANGIFTIDYP